MILSNYFFYSKNWAARAKREWSPPPIVISKFYIFYFIMKKLSLKECNNYLQYQFVSQQSFGYSSLTTEYNNILFQPSCLICSMPILLIAFLDYLMTRLLQMINSSNRMQLYLEDGYAYICFLWFLFMSSCSVIKVSGWMKPILVLS